eukprot:CAMPEP_0205933124 /NCGR_PEP_ID=MMETSP1325-20131115/32041_1 /ASSEMBLY_ACC=CAM_ASM_000708 /TAXON_ID=236786 /ORGANISM="Florenciella sp., Strain RCC1007" /LENGTH=40 /DNA_ID= /DNA_START= /DNA_END= /DNA_ORIENTATION=
MAMQIADRGEDVDRVALVERVRSGRTLHGVEEAMVYADQT